MLTFGPLFPVDLEGFESTSTNTFALTLHCQTSSGKLSRDPLPNTNQPLFEKFELLLL